MVKSRMAVALFALLVMGTVARTQEFQAPKPGPEMEVFKMQEGTWDAKVEMSMGGQELPASKGTMTAKLELGGLWYVTQYKGEFAGTPFSGMSLTSFDPLKKKYVGVWADSMGASLMHSEATYDKATKTMTETMTGPDPTGKPMKWIAKTVIKDNNTMIFTMDSVGAPPDMSSKMKITYSRRK